MQYAAAQAGVGPVGAGGGPPGRGFRLRCSDEYAYADVPDQQILQEFTINAPPGYEVTSVQPCIFPGKNAHRFIVTYRY